MLPTTKLCTTLATAGLLLPATALAAPAKPDLRVGAVTPPAAAAPGAPLPVAVTIRNAGGSGGASVVRLLASADGRASRDDVRLADVRVRALGKGRSAALRTTVRLPAGSPRLIACADARRKLRESRETNNCRASAPVVVRAAGAAASAAAAPVVAVPAPGAVTPVAPPAPPAPAAPAPGPILAKPATLDPACAAKADAPDAAGADTNCDGVDGKVADAVFVSTEGADGAAGTPAAPLRTIADGIAKAKSAGRGSVLVREGVYSETVDLSDGIGLYGGYSTGWTRPGGATTTVRPVKQVDSVSVVALLARWIDEPTTVQRMRFEAPAPTVPGASAYGARVVSSPGLRIVDSVLVAGKGAAGAAGSDGSQGQKGSDGGDGLIGSCDLSGGGLIGLYGIRGTQGGEQGGDGGSGVEGSKGGDGKDGSGPNGGDGGDGGAAGDPGKIGGNGTDGGDGTTGTVGAGGKGGMFDAWYVWRSDAGHVGGNGTPGSGGGGAGAGGGQTGVWVDDGTGSGGAGGGAGGAGGSGGHGGKGGGGSFGLLAADSTGMQLTGTVVQAGDGGAGGPGGAGGKGGLPGQGGYGKSHCLTEIGAGGDGGDGGYGGPGGKGGGGAGGPSYGIRRIDTALTPSGGSVTAGKGGAGGTPGGGAGAAATVGG